MYLDVSFKEYTWLRAALLQFMESQIGQGYPVDDRVEMHTLFSNMGNAAVEKVRPEPIEIRLRLKADRFSFAPWEKTAVTAELWAKSQVHAWAIAQGFADPAVQEVRWNWKGSQQGNYVTGGALCTEK